MVIDEKRIRPLSEKAWGVLALAVAEADLYEGCRGRSEFGGRDRIIRALFRRGYIDRQYRATEAGLAALRRRHQMTG